MGIRLKINRNIIIALIMTVFTMLISVLINIVCPGDYKIALDVVWTACFSVVLIAVFDRLILSLNTMFIVFASWMIRLVLIPIDIVTGIARQPDQFSFFESAVRYVNSEPVSNIQRYTYVLAKEFQVFGTNLFLAKLFNAFLGMLGLAVIMNCMLKLDIKLRIYNAITLMAALSPMSILLSVTVLRESIYYLFVVLSFNYFIEWTMDCSKFDFILSNVLLLPVVWLHGGYIFIAGAYVWMFLINQRGDSLKRIFSKASIFILAIVLIVALVSMSALTYLRIFSGNNLSGMVDVLVEYVERSNGTNARGDSAYLLWTLNVSGIREIIIYTPFRMIYFLISPVLWNVRGIEDLIVVFSDSLIFLLAFAKGFSFKRNKRIGLFSIKEVYDRYSAIIACGLFAIVLISLPFGWGTITAGTAVRHRNCLLPIALLVIAVAEEYIERAREHRNVESCRDDQVCMQDAVGD